MPSPRLQQALAYARAGIPVFAVQAGAKEPLPLSRAYKDATTDERTILAWWAEEDFNLALCPEDAGWCVVDLDGQDGLDTWDGLTSENQPLPNCYSVETPSGGRHLYFKGSLPPSVRKLGPGIDTRGRGSYVLVPPSIVGGVEYRVIDDSDIAPIPEWIEERVQTQHERRTADGDYEADSPERIEEAKRRIRLELHYNGEPQIGQGSDDRAYKLVARLRDYGLSDPTITDMLEALWAPHFDRYWIETKVTNAEKFAQNERGSVHVRSPAEMNAKLLEYVCPQSKISPTAVALPTVNASEETSTQDAPEFARSFDAIRSAEYPPVEWVWQDRLLKGTANLYTGDAGAGKTTLAENIAVACACDVGRFLGADVTPMPVVLIVGEDAEGQVRDNLAAIASGLGVLDHPGMSDIYVRSTLTHEPTDGPWLARIINGVIDWQPFALELAEFIHGLDRPSLIVIDPLVEFVSADTNNDDDASAIGRQFCRMISRFGVGGHTVLVNDHPSKASMASGAHYAGSRHLKSGFALFATLLKGGWGGVNTKQRELTLSVQKARYAAETDTKFYRTSLSPLFVQGGALGERREDHMWRVYKHILERLERGQITQQDERGKIYPPTEVALALNMSPEDVTRAMAGCVADQWLVYKGKESGGTAYKTAHFEKGNFTPAPPAIQF